MNNYDLGDLVALTGRFYSDAALTSPADPTVVTLSLRDPKRVITTPTPTKSSTGVYTYSWIPSLAGLHEVNWSGTGAVYSADQEPVFVKVGIDPGTDLCTLAEVRQALRIQTTTQDDLIEQTIRAASVAIEKRYHRQFAPRGTQTYTFRVTRPLVSLAPYDLQYATPPVLTLDPSGAATPLDATYYKLNLPRDGSSTVGALRLGRNLSTFWATDQWNYGFTELTVQGVWGFPAIPDDVRRAAVITASSWVDRGAESYAMPNMDTDGPNAYPARPETWAIPSAAHSILQQYERMVVV